MAILQDTISTLTGAGYQFIGMDHFALPDDELAVAQRNGVLHRNFKVTPRRAIVIYWDLVFLPFQWSAMCMPKIKRSETLLSASG